MAEEKTVLLTGATGFVGGELDPALRRAGFSVVGATRDPRRARRRFPGRSFRELEVMDYSSTLAALRGCRAAIYLVHLMADERAYERAESIAAHNFARAAAEAGLSRIVYLGGVRPRGAPSPHLHSRLNTGEILRSGKVCAIELQASMIIGAGSESWRIVRDLAARLPVMLLPRWLASRTQPVYIGDVVAAICKALTVDVCGSAAYALPGPETLSAREIIGRTARLLGLSPPMLRLPVITPRLSSYWISLVTRAHPFISRQLVEGLRTDLLAADEGFWRLMPEHQRVGFDEAAARALRAEQGTLPLPGRVLEWLVQWFTPSTPRVKRGTAR